MSVDADVTPRFGLFLGQGGRSWPEVRDRFRLVDELGFDHAWLVDHLTPTDGDRRRPMHESWTLLAAIAACTSRVGLGVLVTNNLFRHPVLLLKEAVTVDHVSNGRLVLGLGAGWFQEEHRRYGFQFPRAAERVERLEEAVHIVRLLEGGGPVSFAGLHYRLDEALLEPRPLRGRLPVVVAGHRPATIRVAARHADQWDTFAPIPGASSEGVAPLEAQIQMFRDACAAAGRDPVTIRRSTWVGEEAMASTQTYRQFVERHARLGFTDFTVAMPRDASVTKAVAREVIPKLRESLKRIVGEEARP